MTYLGKQRICVAHFPKLPDPQQHYKVTKNRNTSQEYPQWDQHWVKNKFKIARTYAQTYLRNLKCTISYNIRTEFEKFDKI